MKECTYHFGVPCSTVWLSHILMGKKVDKWIAISLVVIGVLAALYHSHLWYNENKQQK